MLLLDRQPDTGKFSYGIFCGFPVCLFPVSILNGYYWRGTFAVHFDQLLQLLSNQSALHTEENPNFPKIKAFYANLSEMKEDARRNPSLQKFISLGVMHIG